ncbi:MAG TPA: hypothetical protein VFI27_03435 [candidate division Zixibacteria bacterium]|nr:hypothetical protein [candidate division Zixibacteria bacterium]
MTNLKSDKVTAKRPVGIWALTLFAILFVGILPLFIEVFLLLSDVGEESDDDSPKQIGNPSA